MDSEIRPCRTAILRADGERPVGRQETQEQLNRPPGSVDIQSVRMNAGIAGTVAHIDRLNSGQEYREILGIKVPEITVPVTSTHNLSVIIEAAVRNQILVSRGYNSIEEFIAIQQDAINSSE